MEDRITAGLYLELSDASPDAYAEKRVPELALLPGVERASWWENLRRGRDEFPRTIDEFTSLGVYEVAAGFQPPATPAPGAAYHFLRTPRPSQGSLSGRATVGLLLVLVSPRTPEKAQLLRDWADFIHIRQIAAAGVDGYTMITPYENASGGTPRFLHFYEMDAEDPEAAFQGMAAQTIERRLGNDPRSPEARAWYGHDELVIDYVNTFRRVGIQPA